MTDKSNTLGWFLELFQPFKGWTRNRDFKDVVKVIEEQGSPLGKIVAFNDVGGKKRVIAIGNFIIQGVLRPLHNVLIRYLRSLPSDCTYDQGKVFRWYQTLSDTQKKDLWSLDLSSATDRLPLRLQQEVLGQVLPLSSTPIASY